MKQYELTLVETSGNEYVRVRLDETRIQEVKRAIEGIDHVKKVTNSTYSGKATLNVHPDWTISKEELRDKLEPFLDDFFKGTISYKIEASDQAHFENIQNRILEQLDKAQFSIIVVMAWFTNDILFQKLLEKQSQGVCVKLIVFDDGINKKNGVDFEQIKDHHLVKATQGGKMHNKYCIIDNDTVITGSYNWTTAAETKNDENITIHCICSDGSDLVKKYILETIKIVRN